MLGEGDTFGINGSFGAPEKKICINSSKENTKFCLSLHYNADNSFFMEKRYLSLKPTIISNGFSPTESREVSLNRNVYDFSVDYSSIDKSDIHKYSMTKNNIK